MWKKSLSLADLNQLCINSAVSHLGIMFSAQGENWLEAKLMVDKHTRQPFGLLHGGISATLAETVASAAALLSCEENQLPIGTELNISHLHAIRQGKVTARATPLLLKQRLQVWQIELRDETDKLCAISRLSIQLLTKNT